MLKVNDNGVTITLTGKGIAGGDGVFMFAGALLIGAVAVAMAMSFLPRQLALGALALLVVGMFVFNLLRQKQKKNQREQKGTYVSSGILNVSPHLVEHHGNGRRKSMIVKSTDRIENHGTQLTIYDDTGEKKCHFSGFETAKEVEVMEQVLSGKLLNKRNANIKMQAN